MSFSESKFRTTVPPKKENLEQEFTPNHWCKKSEIFTVLYNQHWKHSIFFHENRRGTAKKKWITMEWPLTLIIHDSYIKILMVKCIEICLLLIELCLLCWNKILSRGQWPRYTIRLVFRPTGSASATATRPSLVYKRVVPLCRGCSLVALRPLIHANLVGTLHGGDAGYSQSFVSSVERSAASGGRVVRVEARGIALKTVR